jgi:hypothetical protein
MIRHRSRDRNIMEGDRNTAYFQAIANQRSRKKLVTSPMGPDGLREDQEGMHKIVVDFYKQLFAKENREGITLDQDFWEMGEKVSQE